MKLAHLILEFWAMIGTLAYLVDNSFIPELDVKER
jgi:hypothetical protein